MSKESTRKNRSSSEVQLKNPDIFASIFALLDIFGHLMNVPA